MTFLMLYILFFVSLFSVQLTTAASVLEQSSTAMPVQMIYETDAECFHLQRLQGNFCPIALYQWVFSKNQRASRLTIAEAVHAKNPIITSAHFFLSVLIYKLRIEGDASGINHLAALGLSSECVDSIKLGDDPTNLFGKLSSIDDYRIYAVMPDLSPLKSHYRVEQLVTTQTLLLIPPSMNAHCQNFGFDLARLSELPDDLFTQGQTVKSFIDEFKTNIRMRCAVRQFFINHVFGPNTFDDSVQGYAFIQAVRFLRPHQVAGHKHILLGFGHGSPVRKLDDNERQAMRKAPPLLQDYSSVLPNSNDRAVKTTMGMPQGTFVKLVKELDQWGLALFYVTTCFPIGHPASYFASHAEDEQSVIDLDNAISALDAHRLSFTLAFAGIAQSPIISNSKIPAFLTPNKSGYKDITQVIHSFLVEADERLMQSKGALVKYANSSDWVVLNNRDNTTERVKVLGNVNQITYKYPFFLDKGSSVVLATKAISQPLEIQCGARLNLSAAGPQVYHLRSLKLYSDEHEKEPQAYTSPSSLSLLIESKLDAISSHFRVNFMHLLLLSWHSKETYLVHIDHVTDEQYGIELKNVLLGIALKAASTAQDGLLASVPYRLLTAEHEHNGIVTQYGFVHDGHGSNAMSVGVNPYKEIERSLGAEAISELNRVKALAARREQLRNKLDALYSR